MSSEAITQNDLREILSRTIGSVPSEYQKLLWTNPNPTSAFAPQTISLDLSNYDAVDVEFRHWTNKDCRVTTRNYLNEGEGVGIGTSTDAPSYGNYRRGFKMYTNGVQFWGGTSNANVDNNSTIPVRIWGIKFERVAPPQIDNTLEVASGTVEHSGFNAVTVAGASSSYKTISFGKTFSKIPQVVVQEHNNSLNNYGAIGISVSYVTTTGFNLYAHGVPQTTLSGMSYDWIAMTQTGE